AVLPEDIQPTGGLDGIQKYNHAVVRSNADHIFDTLKVRRTCCGDVAWNEKRYNSIKSLGLDIATRMSKNAKQIDPKRLDAVTSTIGHKCRRFLQRQICH